MKAALIPPVAHLVDFCYESRFHLVLSHMLTNPDYRAFYRDQRLRGSFLILDNGAHENTSGESMMPLLTQAKSIRASEIVLPDTLFDCDATIKGAEQALSFLLGPGQSIWMDAYPRFMLVPQGKTRQEWERCFEGLITAYQMAAVARPDLFPHSVTIGVSKDYDQWGGGHEGLLEYLSVFHEWMTFEVHLLGWGRRLWMLNRLAHNFPWVRSTDSAKPFVYSINGIALSRAGTIPPYPTRDSSYFDTVLGNEALKIAHHNVRIFREEAHDTSW